MCIRDRLSAGLAFDGDADRCLAVDENGNLVDGDFLIACLLYTSLIAGLCSVGANVKLLGVVPTPAVAYLVKKYLSLIHIYRQN